MRTGCAHGWNHQSLCLCALLDSLVVLLAILCGVVGVEAGVLCGVVSVDTLLGL